MEITLTTFCLFALFLTAAAIIDIKYLFVPDLIHLGILILALASSFENPHPAIGSRILGCFCVGGLMLFVSVMTGGGIGGGDIKLMAASGLLLGFSNTVLALLLAYLMAGLRFAVPFFTGKIDGKTEIPMIPYFAVSLLLSAAFGDAVITWYLHLFT